MKRSGRMLNKRAIKKPEIKAKKKPSKPFSEVNTLNVRGAKPANRRTVSMKA